MSGDRNPWKLSAGYRVVDRGSSRTALMGKPARFWIRHRRGRRIAVYHILSGERWEWRGGTWIRTVEANAGREAG